MILKLLMGENKQVNKEKKTVETVESPKTKKVQVVQTKRIVLEYEVPEELYDNGYRFWDSLKEHQEKTGVKIEPKVIDEKNMDAIFPIGGDALSHQTLKENHLIAAEFIRIWNEYPQESFNSTLHELARTIHEECDTEDYADYLPDDFNEKYLINIGTEEEPDMVENEELWSERYDVEYAAIHAWIRDMSNEDLIMWLRRVIEFIGY
jgi:hypothetical protein